MSVTERSRLELAVRSDGDLKLIPYLMAGYPSRAASISHGRAYADAGVSAIEVGIPHSDPLADGPVIQRAGQAALEGGMTVSGALEVAAAIADRGTPVVLMTCVNPLLAYGPTRFAVECASSGVAGVIVPDLPAEESDPVADPLRASGVDTIFLFAPTSPDSRMHSIAERSSGFVYCVTLAGVTGVRDDLPPRLEELLARARQATELPIVTGFGISQPEHLRRLRGKADAAAVGSALVARENPVELVEELLRACR
ncbi:MAG: tryptophan synthase subunit alpha [Actinobacteria bacterium]|nr:tryptophan synthase subunit alpha [Actinomycetota bacterium]